FGQAQARGPVGWYTREVVRPLRAREGDTAVATGRANRPRKLPGAWLTSTAPATLLLKLKGLRLPRQRRLFAVACCRRVLDVIPDPESRRAVEVAERYADGLASREELDGAFRAAQAVVMQRLERSRRSPRAEQTAAWDAWRLSYAAQLTCAPSGMEEGPAEILRRASHLGAEPARREERAPCRPVRGTFKPRPPPAP